MTALEKCDIAKRIYHEECAKHGSISSMSELSGCSDADSITLRSKYHVILAIFTVKGDEVRLKMMRHFYEGERITSATYG